MDFRDIHAYHFIGFTPTIYVVEEHWAQLLPVMHWLFISEDGHLPGELGKHEYDHGIHTVTVW